MPSSKLSFVAIQAALKAGSILEKAFGTPFTFSAKSRVQDIVTEFDKAAEKSILESIRAYFPDHAILAEESGSLPGKESDYLWIIDPLDGTTNFSRSVPLFCVSIACSYKGDILVSCIYVPMTKELFIAEKGLGAYLNGQRLSVSKETEIKTALLVTGFPYNAEEIPGCMDIFKKMFMQGAQIRDLGSAAIDLAYLAAGRFDAYWCHNLSPWDIAGGKLLVEEAGGIVTTLDSSPIPHASPSSILATNGHLKLF